MTSETTARSVPTGEMTSVPPSDEIALSETDRSRLYMFIHSGQQSARARTRAQVLLKLGDGWTLAEVCRAFDVCRNTVVAVRARFSEGGVDAVLRHKQQARYRQALTGAQQAHLIAVACSKVPDGTRPLDRAHAGQQSHRAGVRGANLARCRTKRPCSNESRRWKLSATSAAPPLRGSSLHAKPVSSSNTSIRWSKRPRATVRKERRAGVSRVGEPGGRAQGRER